VYWPNDSAAFALRSSRRFVERYLTVDRILGSNMPLPEELLEAGFLEQEETIEAEALIEVYEQRQQEAARAWDGLTTRSNPYGSWCPVPRPWCRRGRTRPCGARGPR